MTKSNVSENLAVSIEIVGTSKIVKIGPDWRLTVLDGQEEPRISIAELAARVGHQAVELRRLARGIKDENFSPSDLWVESIGQTPAFTELYLNEPEALFLCTRLRTERATAITWELIRVYILARKGLFPVAKPVSVLDALNAMTAVLNAQAAATETLKLESAAQAERVEALEHQAMAPTPDGMGSVELALAAQWLSNSGRPHNMAVIAACITAGFAKDGRMYQRRAVVAGDRLVNEWRFSPVGVADFLRDVSPSYPAGQFDVVGIKNTYLVYRGSPRRVLG